VLLACPLQAAEAPVGPYDMPTSMALQVQSQTVFFPRSLATKSASQACPAAAAPLVERAVQQQAQLQQHQQQNTHQQQHHQQQELTVIQDPANDAAAAEGQPTRGCGLQVCTTAACSGKALAMASTSVNKISNHAAAIRTIRLQPPALLKAQMRHPASTGVSVAVSQQPLTIAKGALGASGTQQQQQQQRQVWQAQQLLQQQQQQQQQQHVLPALMQVPQQQAAAKLPDDLQQEGGWLCRQPESPTKRQPQQQQKQQQQQQQEEQQRWQTSRRRAVVVVPESWSKIQSAWFSQQSASCSSAAAFAPAVPPAGGEVTPSPSASQAGNTSQSSNVMNSSRPSGPPYVARLQQLQGCQWPWAQGQATAPAAQLGIKPLPGIFSIQPQSSAALVSAAASAAVVSSRAMMTVGTVCMPPPAPLVLSTRALIPAYAAAAHAAAAAGFVNARGMQLPAAQVAAAAGGAMYGRKRLRSEGSCSVASLLAAAEMERQRQQQQQITAAVPSMNEQLQPGNVSLLTAAAATGREWSANPGSVAPHGPDSTMTDGGPWISQPPLNNLPGPSDPSCDLHEDDLSVGLEVAESVGAGGAADSAEQQQLQQQDDEALRRLRQLRSKTLEELTDDEKREKLYVQHPHMTDASMNSLGHVLYSSLPSLLWSVM